ncbi:MAG: hypothetical protein QNJ45_06765 [Ardenticatenaceae bacterium]|nr:hypothetical protein [Ardenticatenaceae bacterium]
MVNKTFRWSLTLIPLLLGLVFVLGTHADEDAVDETWPTGSEISESARDHSNPVIARAPSGEMMVVYARWVSGNTTGEDSDPVYLVSTPGQEGNTWSDPDAIVATPNTGTVSPKVVYDAQNRAHVVWIENTPTLNTVFYARWAGGAFGAFKSVGSYNLPVNQVDVAVSGSTVLIAWDEGSNVRYALSTNSGTSFTAEASAFSGQPNPYLWVNLAVDSNGVFHVGLEKQEIGNKRNVYYGRRNANGTWQDPIQVSTDDPVLQNSYSPDVVVADGKVNMAFTYRTPTNPQNFAVFMRSCPISSACNTGSLWSEQSNISGQFLTVNNTDPTDLIPELFTVSDEMFLYFHGVASSGGAQNEQVWTTKSCKSWAEGGSVPVTQSQVRSTNPQGIAYKAAGQVSFTLFTIYEDPDAHAVMFAKTTLACYANFLPTIVR